MRKRLVTWTLVIAMAALGVPVSAVAGSDATPSYGTIAGQTVNAAGRAVTGQRVELVRSGQVVQAAVTGERGAFAFSKVLPGEYVVRVVVRDQPAGIRVSLAPRGTVANALIVVPSAAAPSANLGAVGFLGWTLIGLGVAAAIAIPIAVSRHDAS